MVGKPGVDIFLPLVWFHFISFLSFDMKYARWALNPGSYACCGRAAERET